MKQFVCLEWQDLSYRIVQDKFNFRNCRNFKEEKRLLINANGKLESGNLIAILGPSGAGKTTLLAAISHRLCGQISGQISLNGHQINRQEIINRSAFVPQFDITIDALTAWEHLYFMSELKQSKYMSYDIKLEKIKQILNKLGLDSIANTRICHLSGGEKKKLNLATELLTNPDILFCDEPTTGLDSYSALSVIQGLQSLATQTHDTNTKSTQTLLDGSQMEILPVNKKQLPVEEVLWNKAIICSIHQPTSMVFECFSHVILMNGGEIIYHGNLERAKQYFTSLGLICPVTYNPAEFYVKMVIEKSDLIVSNNIYNPTNKNQMINMNIEDTRKKPFFKKNGETYIRYKISWLVQVWILIQRTAIASRRDLKDFLFKLSTFLITATAIGALYFGSNAFNQQSIQDINGFCFTVNAQIIFGVAYNVVYFYPSQMPILRRETGERIYHLSAYYVAMIICSIPKSMVECFLFLSIVYPMVGFSQGIELYFKLGLTLTVVAMPSMAYGLMLSGIFESTRLSSDVAPILDVIFLLMAGVYKKLDTFWYFKYGSIFFYANEALSVLIYSDIPELECSNGLDNENCLRNGTEVLKSLYYNTSPVFIFYDYLGLLAIAFVMHIIAFFSVRRIVNKRGYY